MGVIESDRYYADVHGEAGSARCRLVVVGFESLAVQRLGEPLWVLVAGPADAQERLVNLMCGPR